MRSALLRPAALAAAATAATVAVALGPAPAASAAPPATSTLDAASALFGADEGGVTVDGFAWTGPDGPGRSGAVEVFAAGLECVEEQPSFAFDVVRLERARLTGSAPMSCWDGTAARPALVTADVTWAAAGSATTTRLVSRQTRCRTTRTSVPVEVTGSVVVAVEGRAPVVLEHAPGAYDGLRSEVTRCAVPGPRG